MTAKRLVRIPSEGKFAGVCAGLAAYLEVDVTFVRIVWIVLSIVPGGFLGGAIAYLVAWAVMPPTPASSVVLIKQLRRSSARKIAGVCGGIAEYLEVDPTAVRVPWAVLSVVPGAIVLGVLAYLLAWMIMPPAALTQLDAAASHV
jgi:phage shock protein PspC (stress-responsive transcriptional regulator)